MSFTTRQYDRQNNQPNSRRRYTLEPPIHLTTNRNSTNHQEQINNKYRIKSSINKNVDNPWVKELLERDIDFSKLYQHEPPVQFLNIPKTRITDEYPLKLSTIKVNRPSRQWILQQPTNSIRNSNDFHSTQFKSRKPQRLKGDEEQSLIQQQQQNFDIHYRRSHHFSENEKNVKSNVWNLFSSQEKRNILIYILGLMLYKFGLEAFNGSIVSLATNRYDRDAYHSGGTCSYI